MRLLSEKERQMSNILKVGAAQATINYTDEMFPNHRENYTHVHDDSYVQVLIIEAGERFAICAFGAVIPPESHEYRARMAELLGVDEDHLIIHGKHVLSGPHCKRATVDEMFAKSGMHGGPVFTREEAAVLAAREELLCNALEGAGEEAAKAALANIQEAKVGIGIGYTEANINRVLIRNGKCFMTHNPDGLTDHTLPVLRFDNMADEPIAILFNVNCAAGVQENSFMSDGRRAVSGDMAASAERFIEKNYPNTVAIYTMGCSGDQWQAIRALHEVVDKDGNMTTTDLHEIGFTLTDIVGERLAVQVIKTAEEIETAPIESPLKTAAIANEYEANPNPGPGPKPGPGKPKAGCSALKLTDEIGIFFVGVEMCAAAYAYIKENSPFKYTFMLEFANENGGGYLADEYMYEFKCHQASKSRFAAGTAEKFREDIVGLLKGLK